jgi:P-type Cu2+ transporter
MLARRDELASSGRTAVLLAVDGRVVAVIGLADAIRETSARAVEELHGLGVEVVMLSGDNEATARRIAGQLGIDTVIAEVLPGDKAAHVASAAGWQAGRHGRRRPQRRPGPGPGGPRHRHRRRHRRRHRDGRRRPDALGPLDVPIALRIGRGTLRKMRQNLGWAVGYNAVALPIAAGVFEPSLGLVLRPEMAALSMSGSSVIVAVNALMLKRLRLPAPTTTASSAATVDRPRTPTGSRR